MISNKKLETTISTEDDIVRLCYALDKTYLKNLSNGEFCCFPVGINFVFVRNNNPKGPSYIPFKFRNTYIKLQDGC